MNKIKHHPHGFTILEILLALSLFTLTIYAVYSTSFNTTQSLRATRYYQQAVVLTENMNQYLQSHQNNPSAYEAIWQSQLHSSLPAATGNLIISPTKTQIKITWNGLSAEQCQASQSGITGCLITTYTTN